MKRKLLFAIAIGLIAFGYYQTLKNYKPNNKTKKYIQIAESEKVKIFEDNFDSTWEVYGCKYYGWKK
jgi:hypothetical protein